MLVTAVLFLSNAIGYGLQNNGIFLWECLRNKESLGDGFSKKSLEDRTTNQVL